MQHKQKNNHTPRNTDLAQFVFGKSQPQAVDLEAAVLGAILLERRAFNEVVEILQPECFYVDANRLVFDACLSLRHKSQPIDLLTVIEELRSKEQLDLVGGPHYVATLTNSVVSSANIVHHSRIIFQKFIQRQIIKTCGNLTVTAFEDGLDAFDLLDTCTMQLNSINTSVQERKQISIPQVAMNVFVKLHQRVTLARNDEKDENEVYTYMPEWDAINGPLFPGLFVVAGRPGMGKGVFMTELICRMAKNFPVGVINGEMTEEQLLIRVGCNLKSIDNDLWKKNPINITDDELQLVAEAMEEAQTLKLHLDGTTYVHQIAAKFRLWVEKYKIKVGLIDFLTLLQLSEEISKYMTDTQILNTIMGVLRALCKELNLPIILFAQLNRENTKRGGNKEPMLSDLKGSGNIEEFAYQISFLHRPEYYDISEDELGETTKGVLYQIIAKHRDGKLGRLRYDFLAKYSQIKEHQSYQITYGFNPIEPDPF